MKQLLRLLLLPALLLTGCQFYSHQNASRSSGIVEFLYPGKDNAVVAPQMPVLSLPLRVGIGFVPGERAFASRISDLQKQELLDRVAEKFRDQPFVKSIDVIPAGYLRPKGGLDNLDQVKRMLSLDVVVLLSYDQMQFNDQNLLSLTYWTIVGTYIFKGNKNDTQTLVEAVVFDIPSRSFLFRAPGSNQIGSTSTGHAIGENMRRDSAESMRLAIDDLIVNLGRQLESFKGRVREGKAPVRIEHQPGYTGGGSMDAVFAGALALVALGGLLRRRRG